MGKGAIPPPYPIKARLRLCLYTMGKTPEAVALARYEQQAKKRMDTMKNMTLIVALVVAFCGLVTKCAEAMQKMDAESFESCRMIHSDEQCRAWIARGY